MLEKTVPHSFTILPKLPISSVIDQLRNTLTQRHELVLEAPPGAGKTTLVPLALLDEMWLAGQRIVMLEPRRMAARTVAQRMSDLLNEPVGNTVGYRVRQDNRISKHTRIEIITEGILNRMLLQDPSLEGIGLLIFDEFHERNLNSDVGLALVLQGREIFREKQSPLRILAMSATLDGQAIATLLNDAPVIRSTGRMFPVKIIYGKAKRYDENIIEIVIDTLFKVIARHNGSILVFLPGQGEINNVMQRLRDRFSKQDNNNIAVLPLYSALSLREQQRAIEPLEQNESDKNKQPYKRKIVLATDIAETSLTIEGINIVVDAGLCREPRFDPATGMTRLQTQRVSKDSSVQRMGRAGRLAAGYCYRLWSEEQQNQLIQHSIPQIMQADLAPLALQLLAWGVNDINELKWLDLPPAGAMSQALDLLSRLGAIDKNSNNKISASQNQTYTALQDWKLSSHGKQMANVPTHPRLAHMLLSSRQYDLTESAATLAALLSDRSPLNREYGADLSQQLAVVMGDTPCNSQHKAWLKRTQHQAKTFKQLIEITPIQKAGNQSNLALHENDAIGFLLSCAYPDRIAHRKPKSINHYLLSNGRTATLDSQNSLSNNEWLAVAELGGHLNKDGRSRNDRIFSAGAFNPRLFDHQLTELVKERDTLLWEEKSDRFIAEHIRAVGDLVIFRKRIEHLPPEAKQTALVALVNKRGLNILPWDNTLRQWQARVMLLRSLASKKPDDPQWPDVSDQSLMLSVEQWLGPFLDQVSNLSDFQKLDLKTILGNLLPWPLAQKLKELAPSTIKVPSGSNLSIDYTQTPPVLSVKLQEMFGCQTTPCIANGQVKLMLHLLSPARRPLQVTQDLSGFWCNSYTEVRKEMKGRYPKHPWPDNPLDAQPTKYTKHRPQ